MSGLRYSIRSIRIGPPFIFDPRTQTLGHACSGTSHDLSLVIYRRLFHTFYFFFLSRLISHGITHLHFVYDNRRLSSKKKKKFAHRENRNQPVQKFS